MSIRFTTYKVTVIYQYMYSLCFREIHLIRYIWSYCTSFYNEYVNLLCFVINHHKTLLISQIPDQFLCDIPNTIVCCRQVHLQPPKSVDHQLRANIERRGSIRIQPIVVRGIVTLI